MTEPVFDQCKHCGAAWDYPVTYPGSEVTLRATRVYVVADGVHPEHLLCPDCGQRTYADKMTAEEQRAYGEALDRNIARLRSAVPDRPRTVDAYIVGDRGAETFRMPDDAPPP